MWDCRFNQHNEKDNNRQPTLPPFLCLCGTKMNYARVLSGEFKLIHRKRSARSQPYLRSRYRNCQAHPLGIEGSTQFIIDVRQAVQPKVFGWVLLANADFGKRKVRLRTVPHQNRLELLAPPFLSREKVASTNITNFPSEVFQTHTNRSFRPPRSSSARGETPGISPWCP